MGLCMVSAIIQESNQNPIALLESLKEALLKSYQSGLKTLTRDR